MLGGSKSLNGPHDRASLAYMPDQKPLPRSHITEAARHAVAASRAAKRASPEPFGEPELFIVRAADDKGFTWELRRFGGVVLRKGNIGFPNRAMAEAAGAIALEDLLQTPDLPSFERELRSRAGT